MYESISNETFVKEFQILWQNSNIDIRNFLNNIIYDHFDLGERAEKIINKMQEKIEE